MYTEAVRGSRGKQKRTESARVHATRWKLAVSLRAAVTGQLVHDMQRDLWSSVVQLETGLNPK